MAPLTTLMCCGKRDLFQLYGSVLPRAVGSATVGALIGILIKWANNHYDHLSFALHHSDGGIWYHPYSLHVLGMVLGFSLVMRIQIAYQRFWEGTTQCHLACSKWGDAVMQIFAFDEISADAFSEAALEFRMQMLHYSSLMTACALIDIRKDDDDLNAPLTVNPEDAYLFRARLDEGLLHGGQGGRRPSLEASGAVSSEGSHFEQMQQGSEHLGNGREHAANSRKPSRASGRTNTVPMQMLIASRRNLQKRYATDDINSFEALDSKDRHAMPDRTSLARAHARSS